jgi:hypothetical protein
VFIKEATMCISVAEDEINLYPRKNITTPNKL